MFKTLVAGLIVCALTGVANAQEGKIRQASQNRLVEGFVYDELRFTVVGQPNDIVFVTTGHGQIFAALTIRDLKNSFLSGGSYRGSGGDTAVRVRIGSAMPEFSGGRVLIYRGNQLIDADRVRLY